MFTPENDIKTAIIDSGIINASKIYTTVDAEKLNNKILLRGATTDADKIGVLILNSGYTSNCGTGQSSIEIITYWTISIVAHSPLYATASEKWAELMLYLNDYNSKSCGWLDVNNADVETLGGFETFNDLLYMPFKISVKQYIK